MFLFIYTTLFLPFKLAFFNEEGLFLIILDFIVNALFFVDILVTCFTVYNQNGEIIDDLLTIILNYLKSWFVIDLISIFPFDYVIESN